MSASDASATINYPPYQMENYPEAAAFLRLYGVVFTPHRDIQANTPGVDNRVYGWLQPFTDTTGPLGTEYTPQEWIDSSNGLRVSEYYALRSSLIDGASDPDDGPVTYRTSRYMEYRKYLRNDPEGDDTGMGGGLDLLTGNVVWSSDYLSSPLSTAGSPSKTGGAITDVHRLCRGSVRLLLDSDPVLTESLYAEVVVPGACIDMLNTTPAFSGVRYKGRSVDGLEGTGAGFVSAGVVKYAPAQASPTYKLLTVVTQFVPDSRNPEGPPSVLNKDKFKFYDMTSNSGESIILEDGSAATPKIIEYSLASRGPAGLGDNYGSWAISADGRQGVNFRVLTDDTGAFRRWRYQFDVYDNGGLTPIVEVRKDEVPSYLTGERRRFRDRSCEQTGTVRTYTNHYVIDTVWGADHYPLLMDYRGSDLVELSLDISWTQYVETKRIRVYELIGGVWIWQYDDNEETRRVRQEVVLYETYGGIRSAVFSNVLESDDLLYNIVAYSHGISVSLNYADVELGVYGLRIQYPEPTGGLYDPYFIVDYDYWVLPWGDFTSPERRSPGFDRGDPPDPYTGGRDHNDCTGGEAFDVVDTYDDLTLPQLRFYMTLDKDSYVRMMVLRGTAYYFACIPVQEQEGGVSYYYHPPDLVETLNIPGQDVALNPIRRV